MAIRYLSPYARITDEVIESYRPYQRFAISELEFIHTVRVDPVTALAASHPVRVCSAGGTGIAALIAIFGPVLHNMPVTAGGASALAVAGAATLVTARARRQPLEIRAVHQGQLVCLFSTTNRHTLGQVARALLRVIEAADDAR